MKIAATAPDFEVLTHALLSTARQIHARGEEAPPLIAMLLRECSDKGEPVILAVPVPMLQQEASREAGLNFIANILQSSAIRPDVLVVGHMTEAWLSLNPKGTPAQDPARQEGLVISLLSAECQALKVCEIEHVEGMRVIKEQPLQFDSKDAPLVGRFFRQASSMQYS